MRRDPDTQQEAEHGMSTLRILVATVVLLATAVGAYVALYGVPRADAEPDAAASADEETASGDVRAPAALPVPVETAVARRGDLVMRITATGTAEATRQLEVESAVGGTIVEIPVTEGGLVSPGDLLVALDDTELRLTVQMRRESLVRSMAKFAEKQAFLDTDDTSSETMREMAAAQQEVIGGVMSPEQFRALIDDPRFNALFDTISREEVMAAQDGLLTDRANYAVAELELQRARTAAPFGGQIANLLVVVGQRIAPGTKLMTLVESDPIRLRVDVLESEAGLVSVGRRAEVNFAAYPGSRFVGAIEAINPLVDPQTKTLEVLIGLPNSDLQLRPGMFAQVTLDTEIFADRLIVPASAVLLRDDRPMLFVVQDGRSKWVYITKGLENADWVEVTDGLAPGDEVVTDGHYSLAHDAAVRVVNPEESEQDSAP